MESEDPPADEQPTEPATPPASSEAPKPPEPSPSAAWGAPPAQQPRKKSAAAQLAQRRFSLPVWLLVVLPGVALVVGGVIGGATSSGDVDKLEDEKETLERRNAELQDEIGDRSAQREADEAEAGRIAAEQGQAEREAQQREQEALARQQSEQAAADAEAAEAAARRDSVSTGGVYAIGPDINPGQWRTAGPDSRASATTQS